MVTSPHAIGITNSSYRVYSCEEAMEKIAAQGYTHIDFQDFVHIENPLFSQSLKDLERALLDCRSRLSAHGLSVFQAHAPWRWPPKDNSPKERLLWREAIKRSIYGAAALSASVLVVHPLMPYGQGGEHTAELHALNTDFFAALCDFAVPYNVTICIENMPWKTFPLASTSSILALMDDIRRDNIGICLDTGHAACMGEDPAAAITHLGARLHALHLHDNMGDTDAHLWPGDGSIHWPSVCSALRAAHFRGVISLETSPKHEQYPKELWPSREAALYARAKGIADSVFQ